MKIRQTKLPACATIPYYQEIDWDPMPDLSKQVTIETFNGTSLLNEFGSYSFCMSEVMGIIEGYKGGDVLTKFRIRDSRTGILLYVIDKRNMS